MKLNTSEDIYRYLGDMPRFQERGVGAANFDLDEFRVFCDAIGNPQDEYTIIHVAGTNGKGSTCQILGAVYHEAGYKTGLYTSPHLLEYRERFQVDGQCISDEELLAFFNEYEKQLEEHKLSYFELSTAIAFWWFHRRQVDLAVIEAGLGGRLDATNIITPDVSIITNISLDHTDVLGDDIRSIAKEKAGIIKTTIPVVTGNVTGPAQEVIRKAAAENWSSLHETEALRPEWRRGVCVLHEADENLIFANDLIHPVQAWNIAVAWQVTQRVLNKKIKVNENTFRSALKKVKSVFQHPGRYEKLHPDKRWYFDGAHNIGAVQALTETVSAVGSLDQAVLVLSMMKDKIKPEVMEEFQKFKKIYYYTTGSNRAATVRDINKWLPEADVIPDEEPQQIRLLKELESELVIFAGSFYFYATVRKWLTTLHASH